MSSYGAEQAKNIHAYAGYLEEKVNVFRDVQIDFVKAKAANGTSRLRRLPVSQGLLREITVLQRQITALLNCKVGDFIYLFLLDLGC